MLERLTLPGTHAISIILKHHDKVKGLFNRFEKAHSVAEREKTITEAITELKIQSFIEEEIFYPGGPQARRQGCHERGGRGASCRAVLIAELDAIGREDDHRDAKFKVLAESVRHHIKEEENEMLPKAKELGIDFEALGQQMLDRKKEIKEDGIPTDSEHTMVRKLHGRADRNGRADPKVARQEGTRVGRT